MKLGLGLSLSLAACAPAISSSSSSTPIDTREPATHASITLDLTTTTEERAVFPRAQQPRLPSVDRIAHHVRARLGERAVASIELCVAPDGHVTKVALLRGSSYDAFDAAVLRDARAWHFASMPGTTAKQPLQTCRQAKVKYTPQS